MSSHYPSLFSEGINHHHGLAVKGTPMKSDRIFHTEKTNKRFWDVINWETPGRPTRRNPGEQHNGLPFAQSFGMRATIVGYGALDTIPMEDVDDDLYGVIHQLLPRMGGGFARSFSVNEEMVCAELFANSAFTSGTGLATVDGVALCSTAHPISLMNSASTFSNRPSSDVDISISSADDAKTKLMTQYAANNFEILDNPPEIFMCHPSQSRVARQVWQAPWERATADRDMNTLPSYSVEVLEWPYFQKGSTNNAWILFGQDRHLYKVQREAFRAEADKDVLTNSYMVVAQHRFLVCWTDPRGTVGCPGAA